MDGRECQVEGRVKAMVGQALLSGNYYLQLITRVLLQVCVLEGPGGCGGRGGSMASSAYSRGGITPGPGGPSKVAAAHNKPPRSQTPRALLQWLW